MSETNQLKTIKCPNCGAPIDYTNITAATVRCGYCGTSVELPAELRPAMSTLTPGESKLVKATVATGAGCVLGSILLPVVIVLITGIILLVVLGSVFSTVNRVMVASTEPAPVVLESTYSPTPTRAPTPIPPYATAILTLTGSGARNGAFADVRRVGVDGKGNIYAGEYTGRRVYVFNAQGQFLAVWTWQTSSSKATLQGFAVDHNGIISIADGMDIARYDGLTGKPLGKLAYAGGPGFAQISAAPDGGLVAMWYQRREGLITSRDGAREDLVRFDAEGQVTLVISAAISSHTEQVELDNFPVVDGQNNLFVISSMSNAVFKFSPEGKYITRFGSQGNQPGQFAHANIGAVDSQGNLYVGDASGILIFSPDGRYIRSFSTGHVDSAMVLDDNDELFTVVRTALIKYQLGR